ncbi:hypothetical protein NDU88_009672 [Pleurodeles waltl]|uniref:Uncharacterized protein n=1 Tax=Pleurodeles waltl TaxID=8319 RepID=A0AAV7RZ35_PLEWA|nr:hypothetical protein NDU88_009672 [Pleurodeles waltl]
MAGRCVEVRRQELGETRANPPGRSQPKGGGLQIREKEVGPCRGPARWSGNLRHGSGKGPDSWGPPESGNVSQRSRPEVDWCGGWSPRRGTGRNPIVCNLPGCGSWSRSSRQSQRQEASRAGVEALAKWRPELVAVSSKQRMAACRRDQRHG